MLLPDATTIQVGSESTFKCNLAHRRLMLPPVTMQGRTID